MKRIGISFLLAGLSTLHGALAPEDPPSHLLQLFDSTSLHGKLLSLGPERGIEWSHPYAEDPIQLSLDNLSWLRLTPSKRVTTQIKPQCRFRFRNGDEIYGRLIEMNEDIVKLETWFGGSMTAAREAIQGIAFLGDRYSVLYEGPNSMNEWVRGREPNGWSFKDGSLTVSERGTIGRDFGFKESASIAFDLNWEGTFQMNVTMFTDVLDRYDYGKGSYQFFLSPSIIYLQRIQPGRGVLSLGQTRLTNRVSNGRIRFELRVHKPQALFALFANDEMIGSWRDNRDFVGEGSGASFTSQVTGSSFSVSNLLVTEWDGTFESDFEVDSENDQHTLFLVNRDRPRGVVEAIREDKLEFLLRNKIRTKIPVERVMQLFLGHADHDGIGPPGEIRAFLAGGGSVSFQLSNWDDEYVSGTSRNFGDVRFSTDSVRQIQFNLDRHADAVLNSKGMKDDLWDLDGLP